MPKLIVVDRKQMNEKVYRLEQDQITIGRGEDCDIIIPDRAISRHHAEIIYDRRDYYLVDLESGNGTLLNGKPVHPKERQFLRTNDVIGIDPVEIHFVTDHTPEAAREPGRYDEEITDTDIIEIKMIKKLLRGLDADMLPSLQVASGEFEGKKILFTEDMNDCTIGRDEYCSLSIPDKSVSRTHAALSRKWGGIVITDLDSKNGSFVNSERIKEKLLHDGDQVVIGTVKLIYRNPHDISLSAIHRDYERREAVASPAVQSEAEAAATPSEGALSPTASASANPTADDTSTAIPDDALPDLFAPEETPQEAAPRPRQRSATGRSATDRSAAKQSALGKWLGAAADGPVLSTALAYLRKVHEKISPLLDKLDQSSARDLLWVALLVLGGLIFCSALIGMTCLLMD